MSSTVAKLKPTYASLPVPNVVLRTLDGPAKARGMTTVQLANDLLKTIADEQLTDAILDDK
jgi:hypothetical protein